MSDRLKELADDILDKGIYNNKGFIDFRKHIDLILDTYSKLIDDEGAIIESKKNYELLMNLGINKYVIDSYINTLSKKISKKITNNFERFLIRRIKLEDAIREHYPIIDKIKYRDNSSVKSGSKVRSYSKILYKEEDKLHEFINRITEEKKMITTILLNVS